MASVFVGDKSMRKERMLFGLNKKGKVKGKNGRAGMTRKINRSVHSLGE